MTELLNGAQVRMHQFLILERSGAVMGNSIAITKVELLLGRMGIFISEINTIIVCRSWTKTEPLSGNLGKMGVLQVN